MKSFDPYSHFGFLTNRIARLISHRFQPHLHAMGYNFPTSCIGILADLWMRDGVSQKELGMSLIKTKSSITKMLTALEEEGMIVKKNDQNDRRNRLIFLTQKGKEFQHRIEDGAMKMEHNLLGDLPEAEIQIAKKVLKSMYINLSIELSKPIINE